MIETDGDNLGASHIVSGDRANNAIKVPSRRLQRILGEAGVTQRRRVEDRRRGL